MKRYFVYLLSSLSGTLYIGVTNNLVRRVWEHKTGTMQGFTSEYEVNRLVYFESYDDVRKAIEREKQLKRWVRRKKVWLIEQDNPEWKDLSREWYEVGPYKPPSRSMLP